MCNLIEKSTVPCGHKYILSASFNRLMCIRDRLTPDQAFERFFEWTSDRGIELWDHQEEALMDLAAGDHVILGTPTGSGKSLVALGMLFMGMAQGKRCYYTAPIKALVSEKFFDLVQVLGRDTVSYTHLDVYKRQPSDHPILHSL